MIFKSAADENFENGAIMIARPILLSVVFLILDILVLYYAYWATLIDPSDSTPREERYSKITFQIFQEDNFDYYCQFCDTHVLENSKHCGRCNRCTANFDHHCIWLNNCVGGKNYKYFFKLIVCVFLVALFGISISI